MVLFGLGNLIYVMLLFTNGIAVLSEDRFLARIGWSAQPAEQSFGSAGSDPTSIKSRLIGLISSVRTLLRLPLMLVNILVIGYELVLG